MPLGKALTESGGKAAQFNRIGDRVGGTVLGAEMRQANDLDTGKPGFWDNGEKKMQAIITVQTDLRDPADPSDDGVRSIYVKWWGPNRTALQQEIRRTTPHLPEEEQDILRDGYFSATFASEIPPQTRGFSPTKVLSFEYRPPKSGLGKALSEDKGNVPANVNYTGPVSSNGHGQQPWPQQPTTGPAPVPPQYQETLPPATYQTSSAPAAPNPPAAQPEREFAVAAEAPATAPVDPMEVIGRIKTLAANGLDPVAISSLVPQYTKEAIAAIIGA
jgi:hypothetical protein